LVTAAPVKSGSQAAEIRSFARKALKNPRAWCETQTKAQLVIADLVVNIAEGDMDDNPAAVQPRDGGVQTLRSHHALPGPLRAAKKRPAR